MKIFAAILLSVLAVSSALPQKEQALSTFESEDADTRESPERLISGQIVAAIEGLSDRIKEAGLDPYQLGTISAAYALPVPVLLDVSAELADFVVSGVSNIQVNDVSYALLTSRLTIDLSLPKIEIAINRAALDVTVLGKRVHGAVQAKAAIVDARVAGRIQISIGLFGISIRSSSLELSLGGIEFDGEVDVLGSDLTLHVRRFITVLIPDQIKELNKDINELINLLVVDFGNRLLN